MCGIVGIVSSENEFLVVELEKATSCLAHRGPNAQGIWVSNCGRIGFGHRRLSIIDLTIGGAQPMHRADSGCVIVFNGEIYNFTSIRDYLSSKGFRFQSQSDTEALLASYEYWGEDCVDHLEGMFAFAIFDPRKNTVFLARDRAGEKPLFYHLGSNGLRFGSELKALFAFEEVQRKIDPVALQHMLSFGFVPRDQCIILGVRKLPPAHCMTLRLSSMKLSVRRYWGLPEGPHQDEGTEEHALLGALEETLSAAVARQMVADVPIGVLLSGGVDSSIVTALAARHTGNLRTFTVSFSQSQKYDEVSFAEIVARHFRTEHHVLRLGEDSAQCLPLLTGILDEPVFDSSVIPTYLVSRLVRQHCTVVLGGDGGDELFGGYRSYDRLAWFYQNLSSVPRPMRKIASSVGHVLPVGFPARSWVTGLGADLETSVPQLAVFFNSSERYKLLGGHLPRSSSSEELWLEDMPPSHDLVDRATRRDFSWYLPEDILVKVDRASMANSLEMRAPFLDRQVIEFAFSKIPSSLKAVPGKRKILLKRLASQLLPKSLNFERKQGFSIPLESWITDSRYREVFEGSLYRSNSLLDRHYVRSIYEKAIETGRSAERLFGLFILEDWARRYEVSL